MNSTPCTETTSIPITKYAFDLANRCGAKTRPGTACKSPAVRGSKRCRMHGGARGSGAPKGNQNAFKCGLFTQESKDMLRMVRIFIKNQKNQVQG